MLKYRESEGVIAESTMHRINKVNLDRKVNNKVSMITLDMLDEMIAVYNNMTKDNEDNHEKMLDLICMTYRVTRSYNQHPSAKSEMFEVIINNLPEGLELTRRITTNYLQLKTMYNQRKNHKMSTWRSMCGWMEEMPAFKELCLGHEAEVYNG